MSTPISTTIGACRLCDSPNLEVILDLGAQPPANSLRLDRQEKLVSVPLIVCRCSQCTTVQLTESVAPEHLFRSYVWVTGTSQTARDYSKTFYDHLTQRRGGSPLFVVEVASNDGTFLQRFREGGHRVLGVDPAKNLAVEAERAGIPTLAEFFGLAASSDVVRAHGNADVVIARNVIPHVPDPNDVVSGIAHCLKDDGVGAIEFHWSEKILTELQYDSIYHEHFFYHTLRSMEELLLRHSLTPFDVTESPISGGALVVYFSKKPRPATTALREKRAFEVQRGLTSLDAWKEFARRSLEHRELLKAMVEGEIKAGKRLIGYGASARSSTLLNFSGINHQHLRCIADQSPYKHNRYTPGTDVLIVAPEIALAERPDTVVVLAWNFRNEVLNRLRELEFKGDVIIPLPTTPVKHRI